MPPSQTSANAGTDLQRLQRRRKQALRMIAVLCIALLLITQSHWQTAAPGLPIVLQRTGLLLILACLFGRTWCTLYIGGHKKRELITLGPYSVVRNPLYVFTMLGTAGVGLLAGSLALALLFAACAMAIFAWIVRAEEAFLADAFGREFRGYAARVPRFWPRLSAWQNADELLVRPHLVMRTFLEASLFLLAVPLIEVKDLAQTAGWLPVLLRLP
jgi:protein-S-isoprenylcysteine O-methyltransferase Ste14